MSWNADRFRELLHRDVIGAIALLAAAREDKSLDEGAALRLLLASGKVPEVAEQLGREAILRDPALMQDRTFRLVNDLSDALLRRKTVPTRIRELAQQVASGTPLSADERQELITASRDDEDKQGRK